MRRAGIRASSHRTVFPQLVQFPGEGQGPRVCSMPCVGVCDVRRRFSNNFFMGNEAQRKERRAPKGRSGKGCGCTSYRAAVWTNQHYFPCPKRHVRTINRSLLRYYYKTPDYPALLLSRATTQTVATRIEHARPDASEAPSFGVSCRKKADNARS